MKKKNNTFDQQIQEALDPRSEAGEPDIFLEPDKYEDIQVYSTLFQKLDEKPEIQLDASFNKAVIQLAHKQKTRRELVRKGALYVTVTLLFVALSATVSLVMKPEIFWEMLAALSNQVGFVLFGLSIFALIQWLDKTLIKNKMSDSEA